MVYLPTCGWFKIFNVHGDRTSSHRKEYHVGLGDIRKKRTYSDCWPSTLPFLHRNRSSDRGLIARQTLNAIALRGTNTQRTRVSHIHGTCATYDHAGPSSLYINLDGQGGGTTISGFQFLTSKLASAATAFLSAVLLSIACWISWDASTGE